MWSARSHDAFVIEDADYMLLARSNGNHDLHRFLAIADGVVRAQGRRIIFTTNLPNINDVDEALLRPGRCFATVRTRPLERSETASLLRQLIVDEGRRMRCWQNFLDEARAPSRLPTSIARRRAFHST